MRVVDRTLVEAVASRPGWSVHREGTLMFKRPAAVLTRHPPLRGEIRADRGAFVCWFRMASGMPGIHGGGFTNLSYGTQIGKGPVTLPDLERAFELVEGWVETNCAQRGCEHA